MLATAVVLAVLVPTLYRFAVLATEEVAEGLTLSRTPPRKRTAELDRYRHRHRRHHLTASTPSALL
ncbi:hypothetical protein ABT215_30130 [Streptomyces sp900105755]|uniref:hypothetical protein n=1 Tax=Streptomyces sp. 900105755 TaxID=3154389 RepID=UPI003333D728